MSQIVFVATCGLLSLLVLWFGQNGTFVYLLGMHLFSMSVALLIASLLSPRGGVLTRVLQLKPLVQGGRISYGVYLWHFPIFAIVTPSLFGGRSNPTFLAQLVTTPAVAAFSYHAVEQPILSYKERFRGRRTSGQDATDVAKVNFFTPPQPAQNSATRATANTAGLAEFPMPQRTRSGNDSNGTLLVSSTEQA